MSIQSILAKLKIKFKPKTEEEKAKDLEAQKELALIKAAKLRHLIKDNTGWKEFNGLLDNYIEACQIRKLKTRLDTATPEMIQELKFMDRDIYMLEWVKQIPAQFIEKIEKTQEKEGEKQDA